MTPIRKRGSLASGGAMGFLDPLALPYDPLEWAKKPFSEKSRMVCRSWALQGYGTPLGVYALYVFKVLFYVGWVFFCSFTPGIGELRSISSCLLEPLAFHKAIIWTILFDILDLVCGTWPLAV